MKLLISILVFGVTCALAIFWSGCNQVKDKHHDHGGSEQEHVAPEAGQSGQVVREEQPEVLKPVEETGWRDIPDLKSRFLEAFERERVVNEGEAKAIARIEELTANKKLAGKWNRITGVLGLLEENGMAVSEFSDSTFGGVTIIEYNEIANKLNRQVEQFQKWAQKRDAENYQLPAHRIMEYPLDFSPEMHFAFLLDSPSRTDFKPEAIREAAEYRDKILYEYGQLEIDQFVTLSSAYAALQAIDVEIPAKELDEALSSFLPSYANLMRATDDVERRYTDGLRNILAAHGEL